MFNPRRLKKAVKLSKYTTFKIGGPAKYFFIVRNKKDIISVLEWARNRKEKFVILGGGSNMLFLDKGFDGLVIKLGFEDITVKNGIISVGAGVRMNSLLDTCLKNSLSGIEWAAGIPGITLGGAIRGNAGAFGGCMGDIIKKVETLHYDISISRCNILKRNDQRHKTAVFDKSECGFGYRTSLFKEEGDYIILSAELKMERQNKKVIEEKIKKFTKARYKSQPIGYPNAGSVFKNVNLRELESPSRRGQAEADELTRTEAHVFPDEFKKAGIVPAGWLIEQCGIKGKKMGGAMISLEHANIIVNLGGAKAKDVLGLMEFIEREIKRKFGIRLEREIEIVGLNL